jgi:hypothetical protein
MTQSMSSTSPGPVCPRCRRKLAAWLLDHCVYCGEKFPEDIREGFNDPEALKFLQRPDVSPDAAKQLEMMKWVETGSEKKPRAIGAAFALLTLPVFLVIFYLLYRLLSRASLMGGTVVIVVALVFFGYVGWRATRGSQ